MKKKEIRELYLEKRKGLSAGEVEKRSKKIADIFFDTEDLLSVKTLHIFIPIQKFNEFDSWCIIERIWEEYPHINTATSITKKESLVHVVFDETTEFIDDEWGIPTPQDCKVITTDEIDLVVTPLLAFDKNLHRVGYGKGYYDKFFSNCRKDIRKVGVSLFPKLVDPIEDINEFDQSLNRVITF